MYMHFFVEEPGAKIKNLSYLVFDISAANG
jgi:hypothetical protein